MNASFLTLRTQPRLMSTGRTSSVPRRLLRALLAIAKLPSRKVHLGRVDWTDGHWGQSWRRGSLHT